MTATKSGSVDRASPRRSDPQLPVAVAVGREASTPSSVQVLVGLQRHLGNRAVNQILNRANQSANGSAAIISRALVQPWRLQRDPDDPDAGAANPQPGSGTVTIPEVTI